MIAYNFASAASPRRDVGCGGVANDNPRFFFDIRFNVVYNLMLRVQREIRKPEDARTIIKTAKLHESELTEITQVLRFPGIHQENNNLKLMLLDNNLLQEIEAGNELIFKGDHDENVVLCTSNKTFDVKEAETSNSLLLVPNLLFAAKTGLDETIQNNSMECNSVDSSFDKSNNSLNKTTDSDDGDKAPRKIEHVDVVNTFFSYYELKPCKPRLTKLRKLLEDTNYHGPELEYAVDKTKLLSYDAIFEMVQASRHELDDELINIQAINNGYYRLLDFDYEFRVLSYMLDLIEENSWPLNQISKDITLQSLKDLVPPSILEAMFGFYTEKSITDKGVQLYQYKEGKICRFLARVLLKNAGKFNLEEFLQAWRDSVPEGMTTDESQLSGIALVDKSTTPQVIWGFLERDLPEDINQRFKILFQTKPKWTVEQISPYIECYATEKMNVNAILTKYARASTLDGTRVFSAKHMK